MRIVYHHRTQGEEPESIHIDAIVQALGLILGGAKAVSSLLSQIVGGLLGSSILGFHTQFHCNNFVDTVDRFLEARVDREAFTVSFGGKLTAVRRYPISIAWPPEPEVVAPEPVAPESELGLFMTILLFGTGRQAARPDDGRRPRARAPILAGAALRCRSARPSAPAKAARDDSGQGSLF